MRIREHNNKAILLCMVMRSKDGKKIRRKTLREGVYELGIRKVCCSRIKKHMTGKFLPGFFLIQPGGQIFLEQTLPKYIDIYQYY